MEMYVLLNIFLITIMDGSAADEMRAKIEFSTSNGTSSTTNGFNGQPFLWMCNYGLFK
jgi:hypothetical protein